MTIKVKLTTNTSGIVVRPSFSVSSNPTTVVTLKNQVLTVSSTANTRLDGLQDVVSEGEIEGAVPVYDATTDKYVVERLRLSDVDGPLDGGSF